MVDLRQKDRLVLKNIIEEFVETGKPIGSKLVSKRLGNRCSPATVRNIMARLADEGFIGQPHVSAGRIPTEKAFRYYVDYLLDPMRLSQPDRDWLSTMVEEGFDDLDSLLNKLSRTLSVRTSYIGLARTPQTDTMELKEIKFVLVDEHRLLIVLVTKPGEVITNVVDNKERFTSTEINRINNYLNDILDGLPLRNVREKIISEMRREKVLYDKMLAWALSASEHLVAEHLEGDVYIEGQSNMFKVPELVDAEKMFALFRTFEEKHRLVTLLDRVRSGEGRQVHFFSEMDGSELDGLALITAPFGRPEGYGGLLGVLGPTRMDYGRVIRIVDFAAGMVGDYLKQRKGARQ